MNILLLLLVLGGNIILTCRRRRPPKFKFFRKRGNCTVRRKNSPLGCNPDDPHCTGTSIINNLAKFHRIFEKPSMWLKNLDWPVTGLMTCKQPPAQTGPCFAKTSTLMDSHSIRFDSIQFGFVSDFKARFLISTTTSTVVEHTQQTNKKWYQPSNQSIHCTKQEFALSRSFHLLTSLGTFTFFVVTFFPSSTAKAPCPYWMPSFLLFPFALPQTSELNLVIYYSTL